MRCCHPESERIGTKEEGFQSCKLCKMIYAWDGGVWRWMSRYEHKKLLRIKNNIENLRREKLEARN